MWKKGCVQPLVIDCDGLTALISIHPSLFESDGLAVGIFWNLQSEVHCSLGISAFSKSFAFSYGEKLEDTNKAEWPKLPAVLYFTSTRASVLDFLHRNCCAFPGGTVAMFLKGWGMETRVSLNLALFASLAVLSRCTVVMLQQILRLQEKKTSLSYWGTFLPLWQIKLNWLSFSGLSGNPWRKAIPLHKEHRAYGCFMGAPCGTSLKQRCPQGAWSSAGGTA